MSVSEDFGGGVVVDMRGEVGLLTHNVKFRGSSDPQWNDSIPACEAGFDTGMPLEWLYFINNGEKLKSALLLRLNSFTSLSSAC